MDYQDPPYNAIDYVELATVIGAHVDRWARRSFKSFLKIAQTENPDVEERNVGVNLITSLFVLGMIVCERSICSDPSTTLGRFTGACDSVLANVLEKHGAAQPLAMARISIDGQYQFVRASIARTGSFALGASPAIVQLVSQRTAVPSEDSMQKMDLLLDIFVGYIQRELKRYEESITE